MVGDRGVEDGHPRRVTHSRNLIPAPSWVGFPQRQGVQTRGRFPAGHSCELADPALLGGQNIDVPSSGPATATSIAA